MAGWKDLLGTLQTAFRVGKASLNASALTALRTHTLPDESGTLALTSQIIASSGGAPAGNPVVIGSVTTGANPFSVYVSGKYAYVCNQGANTLQVINISNPATPVVIGSVTTGANPFSVYVSGKYAYVCNQGANTLQVINISNPATPVVIGSVTTGANPYSVYVSGKYAYVVNYTADTLQIFNISNPATPASVSSVATGQSPRCVYVSGKYAYVVNYSSNNIQIFDVSNPAAPVSVSTIAASSVQSIYVSGRYLYAGLASSTLAIFDISNPAAPASVGTISTAGAVNSVYVSGMYAYVVTGSSSNSIQVINISIPATPVIVGITVIGQVGSGSNAVFVSGRYAYACVSTNTGSPLFNPLYYLRILDVGGFDYVAANIGSLEAGNIVVNNDVQVGGELQVASGLTVVGTLLVNGAAIGTPAGATNQIQFNNAGAFEGDADLTWTPANNTLTLGGVDTGVVLAAITNEPAASAANTLRMYVKNVAGRMLLKWIGPGGVDMSVQESIAENQVSLISPGSGTVVNVIGCTVTNVGTVSHPTPAATNLLTQTRRFVNTSVATVGGLASTRIAVMECHRGSVAGLGGFRIVARFTLVTLQAGMRAFVGLTDTATTAATNIDPTTSTTPGKIGMAINANTGNWKIVHNITGTAPTVTDLGATFPVNITDSLELQLFAAPNAATVGYRVTNWTTGASTTGTISTNLPAAATFLGRTIWATNNATAAAVAWSMSRFYLGTDF